ncbi:MAG: hypothetical protein NT062_13740 [Proteobacteria bacterium]|nr:hypothetical protein [Pseudomonadota bacterium]
MLALVAVLASGCTVITDSFQINGFSGDPFPIAVETSSGGIVVGLRQAGKDDRVGVIDLLSPITVVDPGMGVGPSIDFADLVVLGQDGAQQLVQPRARLTETQLVSLHPCTTDACVLGPAEAPRPYQAIVGADALAGDTVRLRLVDDAMYIFPDVAGDERHRSFACDTVFPSPYRGGGTLVIGGTELEFAGRRVALQTCLAPNPDPLVPQSQRGTDVLLVASTSIGVSLLGASAYARYRTTQHDVPLPVEQLPARTVNLPSGAVAGHLALIPSIAFVAASASFPRAPCRQVYAHHLFAQHDCTAGDDCPCENGNPLCGVPSIVEVAPAAPLEILVIPDDDPTLQALRTELRPDQAEVDGVLGTQVLRELELDIDYPNDRLLARCTGVAANCQTRPELYERADRQRILDCLGGLPGPILGAASFTR